MERKGDGGKIMNSARSSGVCGAQKKGEKKKGDKTKFKSKRP